MPAEADLQEAVAEVAEVEAGDKNRVRGRDWLLLFSLNYLNNPVNNLSDFPLLQVADPVNNNIVVSGKDAIRPYIARLLETPGLEVTVVKGKRIYILDDLAGYLAKDNIIALEGCYD